MTSSAPEQWSGDMLNRPEVVAAFAAQLRKSINSYAEYVAGIRRDAEAMWAANPPAGYTTFEAWWRNRWVRGPLRDIQDHLEQAATATHALEARYRRGRHEIPEAREAAAAAKNQPPAIGAASRRTSAGPRTGPARPAETGSEQGGGFMNLVQNPKEERSA